MNGPLLVIIFITTNDDLIPTNQMTNYCYLLLTVKNMPTADMRRWDALLLLSLLGPGAKADPAGG